MPDDITPPTEPKPPVVIDEPRDEKPDTQSLVDEVLDRIVVDGPDDEDDAYSESLAREDTDPDPEPDGGASTDGAGDLPDRDRGLLLTNGWTQEEIDATPKSVLDKVLGKLSEPADDDAADEKPKEKKPQQEFSAFDEADREEIVQIVRPVVEQIVHQARVIAEIESARDSLKARFPKIEERWSAVEQRATKMANEKDANFGSVRSLIEEAAAAEFARDIADEQDRKAKKAERQKSLSTPTASGAKAASPHDPRSLSDIALDEIVDKGNLDVRSIRSRY